AGLLLSDNAGRRTPAEGRNVQTHGGRARAARSRAAAGPGLLLVFLRPVEAAALLRRLAYHDAVHARPLPGRGGGEALPLCLQAVRRRAVLQRRPRVPDGRRNLLMLLRLLL